MSTVVQFQILLFDNFFIIKLFVEHKKKFETFFFV